MGGLEIQIYNIGRILILKRRKAIYTKAKAKIILWGVLGKLDLVKYLSAFIDSVFLTIDSGIKLTEVSVMHLILDLNGINVTKNVEAVRSSVTVITQVYDAGTA